ncbi:MAG TPA: cysteine hydrolase family protein [Burkholderiales bacterium]|jgi:nicotinamidase-related amidase|nr:cysteine hydrolase family protein [Burkholderiales bacterium]
MAEHALVIIDIQNDYFHGGKMELEGADAAASNAARALEQFRSKRLPIVHVRHLSTRPGATFFIPGTAGAEIHQRVRPNAGERVIEKNFPNSFRATDLDQVLKASGAKELVVAGMMTHMCVDASVRQAADLGYKVTLLGDACATRAQSFGGESVPAKQVHAAFLAALNGFYAKVIPTHEL